MAGYFLLGTLAAFGLMSILWALLGWLLPAGKGAAVVALGSPDEGLLSRYKWLRSLGLLRCPLLVVLEEGPTGKFCDEIEICRPEELLSRLEWERNGFHGTGNADPAGRDQRRGISEL